MTCQSWKLESVKVDNYDIFEGDILRIDDEDMKDEELLAGLNMAVDGNPLYLICTDRRMYSVFLKDKFNMSVPEIAYSSLKWYDCRYLGIGLGYGVRVSDGELITSFRDIKKKAMQQLVSILEEHGVEKLVHQTDRKVDSAKAEGVPDGYAENYLKALGSFEGGEEEIRDDRLERDVDTDVKTTYMVLTDRRIILVFKNDDFGVPYIGIRYSDAGIYIRKNKLSESICLCNDNLFTVLTSWDEYTVKFIVERVGKSTTTR